MVILMKERCRMRNHRNQFNNTGSALLIVIICIAFIGILGSLIFSVAMTNLRLKKMESKTKANFYTCEIALDEIRVRVQELAAEAIKNVYETEVLVKYADYLNKTETEINQIIQGKVIALLMKRLGEAGDLDDLTLLHTTISPTEIEFTKYLSSLEGMDDSTRNVTIGSLQSEGNSILVKDIYVQFTNGDYQSSITTNIRILLPKFTVSQSDGKINYQMKQPFKNYILIADKGIKSSNDYGKNQIKGSIYAGEDGIIIQNSLGNEHEVEINGENIVTRGNIAVVDKATLTVGSQKKPLLWARNVMTRTTQMYNNSSSYKPTMNLQGTFIVKDDLVLDGLNSQVKLLNGAYLGYTNSLTSLGSSIMINGSGSSLNLQGLTALIIAGRAHISVEDTNLDTTANILTGESLGWKSNQRAYLVPGKFIEGVGHNPITQEDIDRGGWNIDIKNDEEFNYRNYVSTSPTALPYKIAAKQTGVGGASTLRYFYLNFASGKLADSYFREYKNKKLNELKQMGPFTLGDVRLPASGIQSVGNVLSYNSGTKDITLFPGNVLDEEIGNLSIDPTLFVGTELQGSSLTLGMLNSFYDKMKHLLTLKDSTSFYREDDTVLSTTLIPGGVESAINDGYSNDITEEFYFLHQGNYVWSNYDPLKETIDVIDGDVTITENSIINGLLIATGDITVERNVKINGMIISAGKKVGTLVTGGNIILKDFIHVKGRILASDTIHIGSESTYEVGDEIETHLYDIFKKHGVLLRKLFKNVDMTIDFTTTPTTSNLIDLSNVIIYENWRKDQ